MSCRFQNCEKKEKGLGLCVGHYTQQRRGRVLRPLNLGPPKRQIIPHPTDPSLALVELTQGYFAVISAVDGPAVGRFNWCVFLQRGNRTTYARRDGNQKLHGLIADEIGLPRGMIPDHINGNGLDCRRSNLRPATVFENARNAILRKDSTTGVKGVSLRPNGRWRVQVRVDGKPRQIGTFLTLAEAENAAIEARERFYGEFANHGLRLVSTKPPAPAVPPAPPTAPALAAKQGK